MVKRSVGVFICVCLVVLFASCTIRVENPEQPSLFMTWLIDQAEQRLTEAFPDETFWGLWDAIGVTEGFDEVTDRGKSVAEIVKWEFRFASGEIFGQKTGVIEWIDGQWQDPQIVNDQVMEEVLLRDTDLAEVCYDLDQAIMMLRTSGYVGEDDWFANVVFWRPLELGPGEPYYVFRISPGVYIAIGSISGTVEEWYG